MSAVVLPCAGVDRFHDMMFHGYTIHVRGVLR